MISLCVRWSSKSDGETPRAQAILQILSTAILRSALSTDPCRFYECPRERPALQFSSELKVQTRNSLSSRTRSYGVCCLNFQSSSTASLEVTIANSDMHRPQRALMYGTIVSNPQISGLFAQKYSR